MGREGSVEEGWRGGRGVWRGGGIISVLRIPFKTVYSKLAALQIII